MKESKYTIEIFYSEEDEGYIAVVTELPVSAFGETIEMATEEIKIARRLWIKTALEEGREIPKPTDLLPVHLQE